MEYKQKYLKYKNKYLNLKNKNGGSWNLSSSSIHNILRDELDELDLAKLITSYSKNENPFPNIFDIVGNIDEQNIYLIIDRFETFFRTTLGDENIYCSLVHLLAPFSLTINGTESRIRPQNNTIITFNIEPLPIVIKLIYSYHNNRINEIILYYTNNNIIEQGALELPILFKLYYSIISIANIQTIIEQIYNIVYQIYLENEEDVIYDTINNLYQRNENLVYITEQLSLDTYKLHNLRLIATQKHLEKNTNISWEIIDNYIAKK